MSLPPTAQARFFRGAPRALALRDRVREMAENRPGVYRFLGPRHEVLYVGKSVRVRTRLLSYFRKEPGGKLRELLRVAEGLEWDYAPNEFEALLREFRQIRAFRPRFNVRHRRERRYAWVKLTREAAPRLLASRRPVPDGSRYFGPFPAGRGLPGTLRDLAHAVGLRDCPRGTPLHFADQLDLLAGDRTPLCSRAELGSCPAPCAGRCSRDDYRQNVRRAVAFLEDRDDAPVSLLRDRMEEAARRREYERAGRLRDRMEGLEGLRDEIASFRNHLRGLDFVYRLPGGLDGSNPSTHGARARTRETPEAPDRGYLILGGRVRHTFDWPREGGGDPALPATLRKLWREPLTPPEALSPGDREELFLVARWFRDRPGERERAVDLEEFLRSQARRDPAPGPISPPGSRAHG